VVTRNDELVSVNPVGAQDIRQALVDAAKPIKHCGDYGELFYHPEKREVWVTMGDGDGDTEQGYTDLDDIKTMLKLPGIRKVSVEAESDPNEDNGWEDLGRIGARYDPEEEFQKANETVTLKASNLTVCYYPTMTRNGPVMTVGAKPLPIYAFKDVEVQVSRAKPNGRLPHIFKLTDILVNETMHGSMSDVVCSWEDGKVKYRLSTKDARVRQEGGSLEFKLSDLKEKPVATMPQQPMEF